MLLSLPLPEGSLYNSIHVHFEHDRYHHIFALHNAPVGYVSKQNGSDKYVFHPCLIIDISLYQPH